MVADGVRGEETGQNREMKSTEKRKDINRKKTVMLCGVQKND